LIPGAGETFSLKGNRFFLGKFVNKNSKMSGANRYKSWNAQWCKDKCGILNFMVLGKSTAGG